MTTTKSVKAENGKAMTLGEIERFVELARLVGIDGDAKVTVSIAWGGTVKKITAED